MKLTVNDDTKNTFFSLDFLTIQDVEKFLAATVNDPMLTMAERQAVEPESLDMLQQFYNRLMLSVDFEACWVKMLPNTAFTVLGNENDPALVIYKKELYDRLKGEMTFDHGEDSSVEYRVHSTKKPEAVLDPYDGSSVTTKSLEQVMRDNIRNANKRAEHMETNYQDVTMYQISVGMTISKLTDVAAVYQKLKIDCKKDQVLTADVDAIIDNIFILPVQVREKFLKRLGLSGAATAHGLPPPNKENPLLSNKEDASVIYLHDLQRDLEVNFESIDNFLRMPPGQHNALSHALLDDIVAEYPMSHLLTDPNGNLQPLVVMERSNVVMAGKNNIGYNVMAQIKAFKEVYAEVTGRYKGEFTTDDVAKVVDKNIYVQVTHKPGRLWSRYTIRPVKDLTKSSTAVSNFKGIKVHSQRSDKTKLEPDGERNLHIELGYVPPNVFGGDRPSVYFSLVATEFGQKFMLGVEHLLSDGKYRDAVPNAYGDYYLFYASAVLPLIVSDDDNQKRQGYVSSPAKVVEFWDRFILPKLIKVLSSHLGFLGVLGLEASICGIPALAGLLILAEAGAIMGERITAIACHELVARLGGKIASSDGYAGQNQIGGEFRPVNPKLFSMDGVKRVDVGNDHVRDEKHSGLVPHMRYVRRKKLIIKNHAKVLVDLTVPGLLYCPMNELKANNTEIQFKGEKLLMDDKYTESLYLVEELMQLDAFMVYFPMTAFSTVPKVRALEPLAQKFKLSFAPTPVLCLMGVYLVGYSRQAYPGVTPVRDLPIIYLKNNIIAHLVTKTTLLMEHFSAIPISPERIFEDITNYTRYFPGTDKVLRGNVGGLKAYKEYVKRSREKQGTEDFSPSGHFDHFKSNLEAIPESLLELSETDKLAWGSGF